MLPDLHRDVVVVTAETLLTENYFESLRSIEIHIYYGTVLFCTVLCRISW